ncbi:MAG: tRNA (adenine(22)-N(1))-methyltransferase [Lachnospiraceae bacterium]
MVQISKRLQAVAHLVTAHGTVADVGCDHGYIPVYLIETGRIKQAIAMDVNPGPLSRAEEHIKQYHMEKQIELRLSDGVQALQKGEAESVVIAGMGGGLVKKILTEGKEILSDTRELVLQPQSEISRVRAFLQENGYQIVAENMILEDGKYYPMMRVLHAQDTEAKTAKETLEQEKQQWADLLGEKETRIQAVMELYGPFLLKEKHPVLQQYLDRETMQQESIFQKLQAQKQTEKIQKRIQELTYEMRQNQIAQHMIGRE